MASSDRERLPYGSVLILGVYGISETFGAVHFNACLYVDKYYVSEVPVLFSEKTPAFSNKFTMTALFFSVKKEIEAAHCI